MNLKKGSKFDIKGDSDFHAHKINVDDGANLNMKLINLMDLDLVNLASDVDMIRNGKGAHVDFDGNGKGLNHVGSIDA